MFIIIIIIVELPHSQRVRPSSNKEKPEELKSRESTVSKVTGYVLEYRVSIPGRGWDSLLCHKFETKYRAQGISYRRHLHGK
jgi:hypothetical protein